MGPRLQLIPQVRAERSWRGTLRFPGARLPERTRRCRSGQEGIGGGFRQTPALRGPSAPGTSCRAGMLPEPDLEGSRDPRARRGLGPRKGLLPASKLCTGPVVAPSTARVRSTCRRSPPGPAAESVALEESRRGEVCSLRAEQEFPAFPCSQQGRFRPGAAEPR